MQIWRLLAANENTGYIIIALEYYIKYVSYDHDHEGPSDTPRPATGEWYHRIPIVNS